MQSVIILFICLPLLFAKTANDEALEAYRRMAILDVGGGMPVDDTATLIRHWSASYGTQMSAATCKVFCATTIPETMGISAPVCVAACALMKTAIILLVCLPFLFAKTANDEALEVYRRMTPEERMDVHHAVEAIKHWFASHGTQLTGGACTVFCATTTAVETLGISAPICAAACALIGLIG